MRVVTDHGWLFCPNGLPTAELPKHLTARQWARCAAIKGDSQVPVPTAAGSWNPSEQFATPNGAACFNTGGNNSFAHGGMGLQECLTPVMVVSGGASSDMTGMSADLRREAAGGPSVATTAPPIDDGGARLLVDDEELERTTVVAVLLSPDGRVIAQRRTVVKSG